MARAARVKSEDGSGWYHLCARTAGVQGEYPLASRRYRRKMLDVIERYASVYCCRVAGFCVMGNHYHLVVFFEERRAMSPRELRERASRLYPAKDLDAWPAHKWERFERRLFDVSELMRNVQGAYARWFNSRHERRGRFWAERFKSTLLEDALAVLDCLLYIELNPVRAGLVERPEEYDGSSLHLREVKADAWLVPLGELVGVERRGAALRDYRGRVYYRGLAGTSEAHASIPRRVVREEEARGFATRGVFTKRLRHFADGLALGSEEFIARQLERMREQGRYLRRCNPIPQLDGAHATLREQRSNAAAF